MGNDEALACISENPRVIYDYFKQLFAQVTNPPIDPIREDIVMSISCFVGPEGNLLEICESQCHRLLFKNPILTNSQLQTLKSSAEWRCKVIDCCFDAQE